MQKSYPRGQGSASPNRPAENTATAADSQSPAPRQMPSRSPNRFSGRLPSSGLGSPGQMRDGSALLVDGMARDRGASGGATSSFRSRDTIADAHIKALDSQFCKREIGSPFSSFSRRGGGTAAFRSTASSDRDSHIRPLSSRAYAAGGLGSSSRSPNRRDMPSAAFRSASPNACAHIAAMTKPTDASYDVNRSTNSRGGSSAWARSNTSIADAHIKAVPKRADGHSPLGSSRAVGGASASFRSTTSIADAHIKAMTKPVDLLVAYREYA